MGKKTQGRSIHRKTVSPSGLQFIRKKVMSAQPTCMEHPNLGEYLRETRINLGIDLVAVAEETRISAKNLQAIEENNFAALPAHAFARGFYTLYAQCLALDPAEIVRMYTKEQPERRQSIHSTMVTTSKLAQEVSNMARRPSLVPFSFFGLILLLLISFGGFLCWYFSWNPASYLSHKLRSLEEPQQIERVSRNRPEPAPAGTDFRFALLQKIQSGRQEFFALSSPSTATAAVTGDMPGALTSPFALVDNYSINAVFGEKTEIRLKIDNLPERTLLFKSGESITWHAREKAMITLPGQSQTKLTFNNTPFDLPESDKGLITLCFPEDLLQ